MADYIPLDIQTEIMKRLPIKSLIRFRSVSKPWKSRIDNSEFISDYHNTQPQYLLVKFTFQQKSVLIVDGNHTFLQDEFPFTTCKLLNSPKIISSSRGLYCLYEDDITTAVLWNPFIRKSAAISVPNVLHSSHKTVVGFGFCPHTSDPMIVKITSNYNSKVVGPFSYICWQLEVFTLSSGAWRSPSINIPLISVIDGVIYWLAFDGKTMDAEFKWYDLIMSIDMTSEEFKRVYVSYDLQTVGFEVGLYISKLRELHLEHDINIGIDKQAYSVWIMEQWSPKPFTKLFNNTYASIRDVFGYMKNGEPKNQTRNDYIEQAALFVCEPFSQRINYIRIYGKTYAYLGSYYDEQILLLDH